jgi:hypothetical protein
MKNLLSHVINYDDRLMHLLLEEFMNLTLNLPKELKIRHRFKNKKRWKRKTFITTS